MIIKFPQLMKFIPPESDVIWLFFPQFRYSIPDHLGDHFLAAGAFIPSFYDSAVLHNYRPYTKLWNLPLWNRSKEVA